MKHLLLVAYEYPGYHSKSGAALARRVKQVAASFEKNGWMITVIHKDQIGECGVRSYVVQKESEAITRVSVRSNRSEFAFFEQSIIRKLFTLYCLLKKGDRTYRWARAVKDNIQDIGKPDLIISFFTPRGPLELGSYFSKKYGVPWIADLQDELDQGTLSTNKYFSSLNSYLSHIWVRDTLSSANAVVQVSPEWAKADGKILRREVACVRHAVSVNTTVGELYNRDAGSRFQIFYGGSVEPEHQELETLNEVLVRACLPKPVKLVIAGSELTYTAFRSNISSEIEIEYAGWLDGEAYKERIRQAHCCLIVPWSGMNRQAIPSKFYEICTLRPVWIVGKDSGAFRSLTEDCNHPAGDYGSVAFNIAALEKAINNDYSSMFTSDKCGIPLTSEDALCQYYLRLLTEKNNKL